MSSTHPQYKPGQYRLLMAIHIFLAAVTPLIIFVLSSCLKAEEDAQVAVGDGTTASEVSTALTDSLGSASPLSIRQGEFVHIETYQKISDGPKFVTRDTGLTVIDRIEDGDLVRLNVAVEIVEYSSDGESDTLLVEDEVYIANDATPAEVAAANLKLASVEYSIFNDTVYTQNSFSVCSPFADENVSYHNLKRSVVSEPVPDAVIDSEYCGGSSDCNINVHKVEYDQVFWNGDEGIKIHCAFKYSQAVPYLAQQLEQCFTGVVKVDDRSLLLTECSVVRNFLEGN